MIMYHNYSNPLQWFYIYVKIVLKFVYNYYIITHITYYTITS